LSAAITRVAGQASTSVVYNPVAATAVETRTLLEEQLCLIGPGGKRREPRTLRLRDLPRFPLIIPSRPNAIRTLVETRLAASD
jgi:LysR family nitrogen assimilation transcriptional regulator